MIKSYSAHTLPQQKQSWHTYSVAKTLETLGTNPQSGLDTENAAQRQQHYGRNEIEESAGRSNWEILLDQFTNIMLIMLIVVAIISGILDIVELRNSGTTKSGLPFKDTIAIFSIVILNGLLGYLQETRAEKALAALKKLSSPQVQVIREGKRQEVDAPLLVPGDIILVEAGDTLCADGQIIEGSHLQIRESALTGEAHAVEKNILTQGLQEDTPIGDRVNMVFTGTEVIQGRAKAVVTGTGMDTELGKIAEMLQSVETEETPLQRRMTQLGNVLVTGSLVMVALVVVGGTLKAGWGLLQELIEISLSMAVAVVPEGLPAVITVTLALGTQRMVKRHALIRKLPAVETLGSVNVICSDKTGTLTQNKMVVQEVETLEGNYQVTGTGYEPVGEFICSEAKSSSRFGALEALLFTGVLCNDAHLSQEGNDWNIMGDPTEGSLLALAGKAELQQSVLEKQYARVGEFPFTSERKRMSTICQGSQTGDRWPSWQSQGDHQYLLFTKGSPELILERCQYYQQGKRVHSLTEEQKEQVLRGNNGMAKRALRVLGLAYKPLEQIPDATEAEEAEQG